jgi:hypothetical protein
MRRLDAKGGHENVADDDQRDDLDGERDEERGRLVDRPDRPRPDHSAVVLRAP